MTIHMDTRTHVRVHTNTHTQTVFSYLMLYL